MACPQCRSYVGCSTSEGYTCGMCGHLLYRWDDPLPEHSPCSTGCQCGSDWNDDYDCCATLVGPKGMRWDRKQKEFVNR